MPTGWNYIQGGNEKLEGGDVIRAGSFQELLEAVLDYRTSNGIDVGNVYLDVETQICSRFPQQCKGYTPFTDANHPEVKRIRIIDRIARWAAKIGSGQTRKVHQDEAERRAAICEACPNNVAWQADCGGCMKNAQRLCALIRGTSDVSKAGNLRACKVLGHCNRTAIWLDMALINKSDEAPANCWAKR